MERFWIASLSHDPIQLILDTVRHITTSKVYTQLYFTLQLIQFKGTSEACERKKLRD